MKSEVKGISKGLAMIALCGSAAYLNVNGESAGWLWAGVVILLLAILDD